MARSTGQIGKAVEGDQAVGSAAVWHLTIPKHGMGHVFDGIGDGQPGIRVSTMAFLPELVGGCRGGTGFRLILKLQHFASAWFEEWKPRFFPARPWNSHVCLSEAPHFWLPDF